VNLCPWVFIATHWTVAKWSSLEACLGSVRWFEMRADLNMLNHLEVIWSIKPVWNICIIWYFSSIINSNNRHSNETLVGVEIQTSDLRDHRRECYQLSYTTSLVFLPVIWWNIIQGKEFVVHAQLWANFKQGCFVVLKNILYCLLSFY
jgi:hypothetical protein